MLLRDRRVTGVLHGLPLAAEVAGEEEADDVEARNNAGDDQQDRDVDLGDLDVVPGCDARSEDLVIGRSHS